MAQWARTDVLDEEQMHKGLNPFTWQGQPYTLRGQKLGLVGSARTTHGIAEMFQICDGLLATIINDHQADMYTYPEWGYRFRTTLTSLTSFSGKFLPLVQTTSEQVPGVEP